MSRYFLPVTLQFGSSEFFETIGSSEFTAPMWSKWKLVALLQPSLLTDELLCVSGVKVSAITDTYS